MGHATTVVLLYCRSIAVDKCCETFGAIINPNPYQQVSSCTEQNMQNERYVPSHWKSCTVCTVHVTRPSRAAEGGEPWKLRGAKEYKVRGFIQSL